MRTSTFSAFVGVAGVCAVTLPTPLPAQEAPTVGSERWPPVLVEVPAAFQRLGSTTIDLYGVATAEIHVLADVQDGVAERIYWFQFEGVRADNDHIYDYGDEPWCVEIDGRAFHAGPNHYPRTELTEASEGSDSRTVVELIRAAGAELPDALVRVRLVHLDETARNELLILYLEDVKALGTTLDRLDADEAHRDRVFETLRSRAVNGLRLRPAPR